PRILEALRIQHLPAAHVKRILVRIAAIVARGEAVFDETPPHSLTPIFPPAIPASVRHTKLGCALRRAVARKCAHARLRASPSSGRARCGGRRSPQAAGRRWCSRRARPPPALRRPLTSPLAQRA